MAGSKANFTAERVAGFKCAPGRQQSLYWDAKTPGLGLRMTAARAKSYIFETRLHGRTVRITIGSPKTWPIGNAQAEARRLKQLTDQGLDPRQLAREQAEQAEAERDRAAAEERRDALLVREAWSDYVAQHKKRWGARHLADHANLAQAGGAKKRRGKGLTTEGVLHALLQMRMAEVTSDALAQWQAREVANRPTKARQGFELFRAFWRWCAMHAAYKHVIDASAVESRDVRAEVPSRNSKRFDVLERAHLLTWFTAVRALSNPVMSTYLQALLLTGARREEMANLRWEDVDLKWGSLWVKDKVEKDGRKIPLTPYLASLVTGLKRINETHPTVRAIKRDVVAKPWKPSPWVFFSRAAANGRLAEPRIAHNRALKAAGLDHVTLHGLRRTFASLAEWVEIPTGVVAQIMGHKPSATAERHYKSRPLELLAVWHGKYEASILEQAKVVLPASDQSPANRIRAVA